jgi:hypothetical protein
MSTTAADRVDMTTTDVVVIGAAVAHGFVRTRSANTPYIHTPRLRVFLCQDIGRASVPVPERPLESGAKDCR